MAATPEKKVKDAVKKELKLRGIWYYMPVQNGMGVVGIPDLICCWQGRFLAIETKAPGKIGNVTPNQQQRIAEIQGADGIALVVDNVDMLKEALDAYEIEKPGIKTGL